MTNITYVTAMDIYFDGGDWGNENEAGTTGRTAAFNYLLSRLQDDDMSDGRYYESDYLVNGTYNNSLAFEYNAEFAS